VKFMAGGAPRGSPVARGLSGEEGATVVIGDGTDADEATKLLDMSLQFEDIIHNKSLLKGVYEMGFVKPSKIQAAALPVIARRGEGGLGQSMVGQAQNGSGKTATFALALLTALDIDRWEPQAMIICPTRELATQVDSVVSTLGKFMPVRTLLVVPGMDRLYRSPDCHVLIGTPGKLLDICKRTLDARTVSIFVLDEADMMLDSSNAMGPQVLQIRKLLPEKLQVLFFSATYPDDVRQFAESLVPRAMSIRVRKTELTVSSVNQFYLRCECDDGKFGMLTRLYSAMSVGQSVVFVNSRRTAFWLAKQMRDSGYSVSLICGTQAQGEERMDPAIRDQVMQEFRQGVTRVLIATDVLSRGIDVPQVTLVVNFELPVGYSADNSVVMETYLHRVGRTGRFGLKGIAVNLILDSELPLIEEVCSYFDCTIPRLDEDFEALEERLRSLR